MDDTTSMRDLVLITCENCGDSLVVTPRVGTYVPCDCGAEYRLLDATETCWSLVRIDDNKDYGNRNV